MEGQGGTQAHHRPVECQSSGPVFPLRAKRGEHHSVKPTFPTINDSIVLQELEFHGVMRFYFQDAGQKIATKCIRVSSTASTQAVIETLIEKFRPDMKMLHMTEYALYEIHPNGGITKRCTQAPERQLTKLRSLFSSQRSAASARTRNRCSSSSTGTKTTAKVASSCVEPTRNRHCPPSSRPKSPASVASCRSATNATRRKRTSCAR